MRRFSRNRWWALVVALCVGVGWVALSPTSARCGDNSSYIGDGGTDGSTTGGPGSATGIGDPDNPQTSGRTSMHGVREGVGITTMATERGVGSAPVEPRSMWIASIRMALQGLKLYFLRF